MSGRTVLPAALRAVSVAALAAAALAHGQPGMASDPLKNLSLEELLNVEVVSVSRRGERLADTPSAVQVLNAEEVRRSGAVRIPEALRLASNLQVAQTNAAVWALSARGFNSGIANKLLTLLDGRTLYSPLFAGTFWEQQGTLLYDIDRIEVVSGPGATLWGANAVNGVINIITRPASETQGLLLRAAGGAELEGYGAVRYGGAVGERAHYRVYGTYFSHDGTKLASGASSFEDETRARQGGFRLDWLREGGALVTLTGDVYDGGFDQPAGELSYSGHNLVATWSRSRPEGSDMQVRAWYDRASRTNPGLFEDDLDTFDVDFQHRFAPRPAHDLVWGLNYRVMRDDFRGGAYAMLPPRETLHRVSAFVQDEIALTPERLYLTLGAKIEDSEYTSVEWQPSVRLAWRWRPGRMLWAAVSRAVRAPSRLERDFFAPAAPVFTVGDDGYDSEELIAYEVGARLQPSPRLSLTANTFYNDYDDVRSVEPAAPPAPVPLTFGNGLEGESYGIELTADYRVGSRLRVHGGYTWLDVDLRAKPFSLDTLGESTESRDWDQQLLLRSSLDLPRDWAVDATVRFIDEISNAGVPSYTELDLRVAWQATPELELAIVGRNLLDDEHSEFGLPAARRFIERSVFGQLLWRP